MKTIIHVELSDLDRNDLAKRINRDPNCKDLVTRKEVTDLVHALIQDEMRNDAWSVVDIKENEDGQSTKAEPEPEGKGDGTPRQRGERGGTRSVSDDFDPGIVGFTPSRGDEDYLAQPTFPEIAAACTRILDDTALIEGFAWDTVERNRRT
jgi:hypothetical protein